MVGPFDSEVDAVAFHQEHGVLDLTGGLIRESESPAGWLATEDELAREFSTQEEDPAA